MENILWFLLEVVEEAERLEWFSQQLHNVGLGADSKRLLRDSNHTKEVTRLTRDPTASQRAIRHELGTQHKSGTTQL